MGFIGIFLVLLPILAAIITVIVGILVFMGMCLLVIGISGAAMNKIYIKQTQDEKGVSKRIYNISSVIAGIMLMLTPLGLGLYAIIASAIPK